MKRYYKMIIDALGLFIGGLALMGMIWLSRPNVQYNQIQAQMRGMQQSIELAISEQCGMTISNMK